MQTALSTLTNPQKRSLLKKAKLSRIWRIFKDNVKIRKKSPLNAFYPFKATQLWTKPEKLKIGAFLKADFFKFGQKITYCG